MSTVTWDPKKVEVVIKGGGVMIGGVDGDVLPNDVVVEILTWATGCLVHEAMRAQKAVWNER